MDADNTNLKEEHTIIKLSREDSKAFVDALLNPPELDSNEPLARAIRRYTKDRLEPHFPKIVENS